jgi:hypothetical protein
MIHARTSYPLGRTYNLNNCPAWNHKGDDITLNGRYVIEEYQPIEPSAYAWTAYYLVSPADVDGDMADDDVASVDPDTLWEHATEVETREQRLARLAAEAAEYSREMVVLEAEPPIKSVADLAARNRWGSPR